MKPDAEKSSTTYLVQLVVKIKRLHPKITCQSQNWKLRRQCFDTSVRDVWTLVTRYRLDFFFLVEDEWNLAAMDRREFPAETKAENDRRCKWGHERQKSCPFSNPIILEEARALLLGPSPGHAFFSFSSPLNPSIICMLSMGGYSVGNAYRLVISRLN